MASLLFPCVQPLTKTSAILRIVSTLLPVRTLRTCVNSHRLVAVNRPVIHSFTSCKILFSHEFVIGVSQKRRCFTSQANDNSVSSLGSVSKSDSQKTEEMCEESKSTTGHSEVDSVEQVDSYRTLHMCSEEGRVTFQLAMEQQSCSPYGLSTNVLQSCEKEDAVFTTNTSPFDSDVRSGIKYSSDKDSVVTLDSPPMPDGHVDTTSLPLPAGEGDPQELPSPQPMEPSFTLAPYVAQSEVLQNLVALGVDLSAVEKVKEAADCLVQADWTADIQPRLLFLRDVGVEDAQLGQVLTKNPLLLKEDIEEMQGRVSYLESKKFSQEQITRIVISAPLTLLLPVTYVDKKLGFLQKTFHLTGDEVRFVASRLPKIIPWKLQKLKDIRFYMKEMLGFSDRELKAMLLATPRVFLSDRHQLGKKFDFLHNVMGLSHQHLTTWPAAFRTRLHIMEQRHRFLLLLGRAQYDPTKENYVSLKALVSGRDRDFCFHVAKASTSQFHSFLKSL